MGVGWSAPPLSLYLALARRRVLTPPRRRAPTHSTKQVLYRTWGTFSAISITISAMSVLTSITASLWTGERPEGGFCFVRAPHTHGRQRQRRCRGGVLRLRRRRRLAHPKAPQNKPLENNNQTKPNQPPTHKTKQRKGLYYGGPVVIVWGWMLVSALMMCVGLGMAELVSAYPTSGGMYYCELFGGSALFYF